MDSLQEAFIHPPEPCEARFIMDEHTLFDYFWTVEQKHSRYTPVIKLGRARTILYNSDWILLKEESHIHLGCLEGRAVR